MSDDTISRQAAIDALAEQIMESALMDNPTTASTDIDRYRPIAELSLRKVPSAQPLTEEDYIELRDRFGDEVEAVVRDMVSGEGKRWMT